MGKAVGEGLEGHGGDRAIGEGSELLQQVPTINQLFANARRGRAYDPYPALEVTVAALPEDPEALPEWDAALLRMLH